MKAMRVLFLIPLWATLALGQTIEETPPNQAPISQAVDLDFSDDFPPPAKRVSTKRPLPVAKSAPAPAASAAASSRSWVYWTLGFSAMASGMAWYLHWDMSQTIQPTRNDQVFTDDPG